MYPSSITQESAMDISQDRIAQERGPLIEDGQNGIQRSLAQELQQNEQAAIEEANQVDTDGEEPDEGNMSATNGE